MAKILVIEDERSVRTNIIDLLVVEGFEVLGAENGPTGIKITRENKPDLVICDILMPKMDGFEVLRLLGEDAATATIPVIFLTAKTERADMRQGMELGAYDYLTKPFTRAELLGAVHAQIKKRDLLLQQYIEACQELDALKSKVSELQQFSAAKDQLLNNVVEELRNPMANITMSIRMLREAPSGAQRDRYLKILQEEFAREIALLNQVTELQQLLTPANIKLLKQFNLLQGEGN
ncbi:MAG TPA: response regulator [Synechococcales cyanobacterium M55_K2018_004]|nr:response regulator [Synechococcales cyanobacterium M55_K2018_004]